jgi:hypothetical protein
MSSLTKTQLIAPCGMNCEICMAYLRPKNRCKGCRAIDDNIPITRLRCKIKNCGFYDDGKKKYCFECKNFPCMHIKNLDKRYRTRYSISMIENLQNIKKSGIRKLVKSEEKRWACPESGAPICVHNRKCYGYKIKTEKA